ncbi:MAG: amidohydrolase family protein [Candidatus Eisenbacteria bacterium]|nr:amidohydrolase family protein [Candidatus Eisenbacteria bacterium]
MTGLDLTELEIVDGHCHPVRFSEVLGRDREGLEARMTLPGACWELGSEGAAEGPRSVWSWDDVVRSAGGAVVALALRRRLAEFLGCPAEKEALAVARDAALRADPKGYFERLLKEQRIVALLVDDGTPGHISHEAFERQTDAVVHRVHRIDAMIGRHLAGDFSEFLEGVMSEVEIAARDPRTVAFKSFIMYYSGGDIADPSELEAREAFGRWSAADLTPDPGLRKPIWDFVLRRVAEAARREGKALHFHIGAEGHEGVIGRPFDFYPFIYSQAGLPLVLMHVGMPWIRETGYLAATFPHVNLDLSEITLWAPGQIDEVLTTLLGWVSTTQILYGSDMCVEPEQAWLAAGFVRPALTRVLSAYIERDLLTEREAHRAAAAVLAGNTRRVHGLS